jgi:hypothetical protein
MRMTYSAKRFARRGTDEEGERYRRMGMAILTRAQRAGVATAAVAPATVAGIALIRCGCSSAAWIIELVTAALFALWIWRSER